jgi:hypothetical protein
LLARQSPAVACMSSPYSAMLRLLLNWPVSSV